MNKEITTKEIKELMQTIMNEINEDVEKNGEDLCVSKTLYEVLYEFLSNYKTVSDKENLSNRDYFDGNYIEQILNINEETKKVYQELKQSINEFENNVLYEDHDIEYVGTVINDFQDSLLSSYLNFEMLNKIFYNERDLSTAQFDNTLYDYWERKITIKKIHNRYDILNEYLAKNQSITNMYLKDIMSDIIGENNVKLHIKKAVDSPWAYLEARVEKEYCVFTYRLGDIGKTEIRLYPDRFSDKAKDEIAYHNLYVTKGTLEYNIFKTKPQEFVTKLNEMLFEIREGLIEIKNKK